MIDNMPTRNWKDADEVFDWWLYGEGRDREGDSLFEIGDEE
jgi:hypothetical protein